MIRIYLFVLVALLLFSCREEQVNNSALPSNEIGVLNAFVIDYPTLHYAFSTHHIDSLRQVAQTFSNEKVAGSRLPLLTLTAIHYQRTFNLVESLSLFLDALKLSQVEGQRALEGAINQMIAAVYRSQHNTSKAMTHQLLAHQIWMELDMADKVAHNLNFQGRLLKEQGMYDLALTKFDSAHNIFLSLQDERGLLPTLDQIAKLYLDMENYEAALTYHRQVYSRAQLLPNSLKAPAARSIADCFRLLNQYDSAEYYFAKALLQSKDLHYQCDMYIQLAEMSMLEEDWELALHRMDEALSLIEQDPTPRFLSLIHKDYALIYEELGMLDKALLHMSEYQHFFEEAAKESNSEALSRLVLENEVEKKDLLIQSQKLNIKAKNATLYLLLTGILALIIISLLVFRTYMVSKKSRDKIAKQNERIQRNLLERESLLKEIHHRVKNNLQVVASLLYLQSGKFEDENIKQVLEEGQGRVRSMALIHQKLYENEDLKSIPFQEYLNELVGEIRSSFGSDMERIHLNIHAGDACFDVDTAVPLGLIVNELTTNAFKYAFTKGVKGTLSIFLTREENRYTLNIKDDGKGIPEEVDIRKTKSLGLRLVRALSAQLEGDFEFKQENGTSFELKFAA